MIKGRNLRVYLNGVDTTLGGEKTCKLQIKADSKEIASIVSGTWKEFKAGRLSWSVSAGGLYTAKDVDLTTLMVARTPVFLVFDIADHLSYYGKVLITDCEKSGEVKGYATWSVTFKGTGPLASAAWALGSGGESDTITLASTSYFTFFWDAPHTADQWGITQNGVKVVTSTDMAAHQRKTVELTAGTYEFGCSSHSGNKYWRIIPKS